jgi:PhnB protein
MPIADGPFGSHFGMFADKFGVQWMVDFTQNITGKGKDLC